MTPSWLSRLRATSGADTSTCRGVLLQDLEDFQVIALDEDVLGRIPLFGVGLIRPQHGGGGQLCRPHGTRLPGPGQAEARGGIGSIRAKELAELRDVDPAVTERFGNELS